MRKINQIMNKGCLEWHSGSWKTSLATLLHTQWQIHRVWEYFHFLESWDTVPWIDLQNDHRCHISEFDETEFQLFLLGLQGGGAAAAGHQGQCGGGSPRGQESAAIQTWRRHRSDGGLGAQGGLADALGHRSYRPLRRCVGWCVCAFEAVPMTLRGAHEGTLRGGPGFAASQFGWVGLEGRHQWRQHTLFKRCANLAAAQ